MCWCSCLQGRITPLLRIAAVFHAWASLAMLWHHSWTKRFVGQEVGPWFSLFLPLLPCLLPFSSHSFLPSLTSSLPSFLLSFLWPLFLSSPSSYSLFLLLLLSPSLPLSNPIILITLLEHRHNYQTLVYWKNLHRENLETFRRTCCPVATVGMTAKTVLNMGILQTSNYVVIWGSRNTAKPNGDRLCRPLSSHCHKTD